MDLLLDRVGINLVRRNLSWRKEINNNVGKLLPMAILIGLGIKLVLIKENSQSPGKQEGRIAMLYKLNL